MHNLELVDGYSTLISKRYYQQAWGFTGKWWNYYTLSIPPMGIYLHEKQVPQSKVLGEFNTKFIISPYALTNKSFKMINYIDGFYFYENEDFLPRAYFVDDDLNFMQKAEIIDYNVNQIKIAINSDSQRLVLSQSYSPGWYASVDGQKLNVQETPNALLLVSNIPPQSKFVTLKYRPKGFLLFK